MGFILNRPLKVQLHEILDIETPNSFPLYSGGPVAQGRAGKGCDGARSHEKQRLLIAQLRVRQRQVWKVEVTAAMALATRLQLLRCCCLWEFRERLERLNLCI